VLGTFSRFGLQATGWHPSYRTVQNLARNDIEFWSNLPLENLCQCVGQMPEQREVTVSCYNGSRFPSLERVVDRGR
jgi:hypothetical protein